ncbi:MAG: 16S rRNA (cytosine(1402)-N(4))-methyltransferase, partial [Bacteroidales bacterium]
GNMKVPFRAVNHRVIVPSENEVSKNSRARSARLRIAEKI